ncbi:MAG: CHAT domain-containing protein, partial [Gemmataceae bacterium]|nr:CHAT domain-containing protein [Gemmataceae bacterium]
LDAKHRDRAAILLNVASLLGETGDPSAGLPLAEEARAIRKEVLGEKHPEYAQSLNNLGWLHELDRDPAAALLLFRRALAIRREVLGPRDPAYATSLNNLAHALAALGRLGAARPLFEKALELRLEVLGEKHPDTSVSLNNLALLFKETAEFDKARPLYRKALAIREQVLGKRHLGYARSLMNLAWLHRDSGDPEAALPLAEEALGIAFAHLRDNAAVQSDQGQLAALRSFRYYLDQRLRLPDREGHPTAAAHVLAWKGQVLTRQQQRRLFLRLAADPEARREAERLQAVTRELAALRASPSATAPRVAALEKRQAEAQEKLSGSSAAFRASRVKETVTPEALAKALPEGVVLVDYFFHGEFASAFVHRRGQPARRMGLGRIDPIERAVSEWRSLLVARKPDGKAGQSLRKLVLAPVEKWLEGAKTLLVSPDGALGTVPFAALPGKKEGGFLIEEMAVAVVPVPGALPGLLRKPDAKDRLEPSLLVVGDLRYEPEEGALAPPAGADDRSGPRTGREKFAPLPATRAEALAVRASFDKLFKGGKATALAEGEATKKAVREALPKARYAHFATHGWFSPETKGGWHPLLLSGLVLSDANRLPKPGEEDGILTALEVSEMDLTRLELAVLSACETGLGKVADGEGLLGLQRAFAVAGARSVVSSLWKVDDRAAQHLMADFYAAAWNPKTRLDRAEALRMAQLALMKEGRGRGVGKEAEKLPKGETRLPPYYWAAFVLSGDWR